MHSQDRFNVIDKKQFNSYPYGDSDKLLEDPGSNEFMQRMNAYEQQKKDNNVVNVLGISTTMVEKFKQPKYQRQSTSDRALERALELAKDAANNDKFKENVKCETVLLKLRDLNIRECEGYYSKDKTECRWPCVISNNDMSNTGDKMDVIYWALAYWADVVFIATPIRYGNAGSLYYKMVERLNSIHNEMTLNDHYVIKDKVAAFIITGGQDGVQAIAGQMLTFWSEIGYAFSRYSYVGWNRGWYAENTKKNFPTMTRNKDFARDLQKMVEYAIDIRLRLRKSPTTLKDDYERRAENPLIREVDRDLTAEEEAQPPII